MESLLIHWHTSLKFSSENRNPQIPEMGPFIPMGTGTIQSQKIKIRRAEMQIRSLCLRFQNMHNGIVLLW